MHSSFITAVVKRHAFIPEHMNCDIRSDVDLVSLELIPHTVECKIFKKPNIATGQQLNFSLQNKSSLIKLLLYCKKAVLGAWQCL